MRWIISDNTDWDKDNLIKSKENSIWDDVDVMEAGCKRVFILLQDVNGMQRKSFLKQNRQISYSGESHT